MRVPNCRVQIPAHTYLEVKIEMIWSETNISIRCLKCGELFFQSGIQRDDEYTRYRCGCDGDIEIVNLKVLDLLILVPLLILLIVITHLKGSICYEKCK